MLISLFLLAAADLQPVTQAEFRAQAKRCGVSLEYRRGVEEGYGAWVSGDGKEFYIRDNRPKDPVKCMIDWASRHHLMIILVRT